MKSLKNVNYDDMEFLVERMAEESPLFNRYIQSLLSDTDKAYPTNEVWLGTLQLGQEKIETQIKLTVTQAAANFIDEGE